MKKIIALAVAGAFVAPAYAADISVSGSVEYVYVTGEQASDGADVNYITPNDNLINVTATEEVGAVTVGASLTIIDDTDDDAGFYTNDGSNISLAGAFGKFTVGDTSGAMDSVGDYTDMASYFGGFGLDGDDAIVKLTLPTIQGLTINVAASPENSSGVAPNDSVYTDGQGASVKYNFGMGEVYYAAEEIASKQASAYGVKVSAAGFTVAAEFGTEDGTGDNTAKTKHSGTFTSGGGDLDFVSYAAKYQIGDVVIGGEMHSVEEAGNDTDIKDLSVIFAEYNLGSNVDLYVSHQTEDGIGYAEAASGAATAKNTASQTAVGVEYNF